MVTIYSAKKERDIEIIEATLLSEEELEACEKYVTCPAYFEPKYWYLRDACDNNQVAMAFDYYVDDPSSPDYEDFPPDGPGGTGLRPILRIKPTKNVKAGDIICISDDYNNRERFTAISDTILLSDLMIDFDFEGNSYGIFDEETNEYENSSAKQRVDKWFEWVKENI